MVFLFVLIIFSGFVQIQKSGTGASGYWIGGGGGVAPSPSPETALGSLRSPIFFALFSTKEPGPRLAFGSNPEIQDGGPRWPPFRND